jgi:hypothetical protein
MTVAAIDRLVHHATILELNAESMDWSVAWRCRALLTAPHSAVSEAVSTHLRDAVNRRSSFSTERP